MSGFTTPVVEVKDRFLVTSATEERFFLKGIAFPNAPLERIEATSDATRVQYNATGWIAVLEQLREGLPPEALNTIRMYQLDAGVDYSRFYKAAADLGFYVLIPLTSNDGGATLSRLEKPPNCYPKELWDYGKTMVQSSLEHPNILAGVIGNEVMNSMESWHAAPCIKAYARDLMRYTKSLQQEFQGNAALQDRFQNRTTATGTLAPLPLLYAAQDSGIGAALSNVDTIRLSVDYLSCEADLWGGIGVFGVNVESWCASRDTFRYNDDGTDGTFYQLWQGLHTAAEVPLVFSELGCSHSFFNRDTPELRTREGTRDWTEVPVVLGKMRDTWSGFLAYAYWGNSLFNMMKRGPWNGRDVLEPTQDFDHFQKECLLASALEGDGEQTETAGADSQVAAGSLHDLPMMNGGIMEQYYQMLEQTKQPPTCNQVESVWAKAANLKLSPLSELPTHYEGGETTLASNLTLSMIYPAHSSFLYLTKQNQGWKLCSLVPFAGLITLVVLRRRYKNPLRGEYEPVQEAMEPNNP